MVRNYNVFLFDMRVFASYVLWPDCVRILTESEQKRAKVIKCTQITFEWISLRNSFVPERSRCTELEWVRPSEKIKIDNCIDLVTGLTSNPDCRVIYLIFRLQSWWVISNDSIHSESFIPATNVFTKFCPSIDNVLDFISSKIQFLALRSSFAPLITLSKVGAYVRTRPSMSFQG